MSLIARIDSKFMRSDGTKVTFLIESTRPHFVVMAYQNNLRLQRNCYFHLQS